MILRFHRIFCFQSHLSLKSHASEPVAAVGASHMAWKCFPHVIFGSKTLRHITGFTEKKGEHDRFIGENERFIKVSTRYLKHMNKIKLVNGVEKDALFSESCNEIR